MYGIKVFYNFLPHIKDIYSLCKKLEFYSNEDFNKKFPHDQQSWPGLRTENLKHSCPFLYIHIHTLLQQSLMFNYNQYSDISMYCHVRFEEDDPKDWVHVDPTDTAIIYLSPTNLNSGTNFYDGEKENVIGSTNFVQGSCVFFNQGIAHRSIGNHGTSIDDARLTINAFMVG